MMSPGYSKGIQKVSGVLGNFLIIPHRQQRTIRAAFYFTSMQLYRGHLLDEFLQANFHDRLSLTPALPVQKCIHAALQMALFAADIKEDVTYNSVFWVYHLHLSWLLILFLD